MWHNDVTDSELWSLSFEQGKESSQYHTLTETWDSDGYSHYSPSFQSRHLSSTDFKTDAKKHYYQRSHSHSRNDPKVNSNNRYYHNQEYSRNSSQFKHWLDEKDFQTKSSRSESRSKKERKEEKRKHPERINPAYMVNAPSCYGYFSYEDVVHQLQGNKKIYKHSTEKKLY